MSDSVKLPKNHLRSVSVSMYLVEKSIDEYEELLKEKKGGVTYEIVNDIDEQEIKSDLEVISGVRKMISKMSEKYGLNRDITYLSRIRNSKKSKMWEILCDTNSKRLKGFGELPNDIGEEVDRDINSIIELVERL